MILPSVHLNCLPHMRRPSNILTGHTKNMYMSLMCLTQSHSYMYPFIKTTGGCVYPYGSRESIKRSNPTWKIGFYFQMHSTKNLVFMLPHEPAVMVLSWCYSFELCQGKSGSLIWFLYLIRFILLASHCNCCKVNMALCERLWQADVLSLLCEAGVTLKGSASEKESIQDRFLVRGNC